MSDKKQGPRGWSHKGQSRRQFLKKTSAGVALFHFVPAHVLRGADKPSDKINIAAIGGGGRAGANLRRCGGENIVAVADVDDTRAAKSHERFPQATRYKDFRVLLDEMDQKIDAVGRGKHVYCEKPLSHSICESRQMLTASRAAGVITQLGNQGKSFKSIRQFVEMIWDGAIGDVTEIHISCQALSEHYSRVHDLPSLPEKHPIPKDLDWDLWLGPAPDRSYHPYYVPFSWRGWMDYGTGCIGDWSCHMRDPSMWALGLDVVTSVHAEIDPTYDLEKHAFTYPSATKITFEFPAKGNRGPVKLVWFDGTNIMPRPDTMEADQEVPKLGVIVYGTKGAIVHGSHGAHKARIIPESRRKEYQPPEPSIPRVENHQQDWLEAIRNNRPAGSDFEYGANLTEVGLLGAIAIRFPKQKLEWDSAAMKFTNFPAANAYVRPTYRDGWDLRRRRRV